MKNIFHITKIEKINMGKKMNLHICGWYSNLEPSHVDKLRFFVNGQETFPNIQRTEGIQIRLKYLRQRANIDVEYEYTLEIDTSDRKSIKLLIRQQLEDTCVTQVSFDVAQISTGDLTDQLLGKIYKVKSLLWEVGLLGLWEKIIAKISGKTFGMSSRQMKQVYNHHINKMRFPVEILDPRNISFGSGNYVFANTDTCLLSEDAFDKVSEIFKNKPEIDLVYTDEVINNIPYFKPDTDEFLIRSHNYVGNAIFVREDLYKKVMAEGSWDSEYEYTLRCWEFSNGRYHIPEVLAYSTKKVKSDEEHQKEIDALRKYYNKNKISAEDIVLDENGFYHTSYTIMSSPLVSIIIPNKDHIADLQKCVHSILNKTLYSNYEILIVENNSNNEATFEGYEELQKLDPRIRVIIWDKAFNYSAINNYAVASAHGEYLVFLNNDTELISEKWLHEFLGCCMQADVGAAGAKLYYEDRTIQHAGVVIGLGGIAGHAFGTCSETLDTYKQYGCCMREVSAVTAACMMVKREVFELVEGFCEDLKVAFNDIDLCLKIRNAGKKIVYNPYVALYHYESKSRGMEDTSEKVERFHQEICLLVERHPTIMVGTDEFYNPNLTIDRPDYTVNTRIL